MYDRCIFYEYMFLIIFIQIIVHKLNDEISKGIIPISELSKMYTSILESLNTINRTIVGPPVLFNVILGNVSSIIFVLFNYVLFRDVFIKVDIHIFFPILSVLIRLFDIGILFYLCQATENEVCYFTYYFFISTHYKQINKTFDILCEILIFNC